MHVNALSIVHLAVALAGTAAAISIPHNHAVHEKRHIPHPRINKRMEPHAVLPMRVGLKQNTAALEAAEEWLMEVSHPSSPKFGQHWTSDEVVAAFSPPEETVETVAAWLIQSGIEKDRITHSGNKAWLAFDATVAEAERLLNTQYFHDGIEEDRGSMVGCNEYHLPKHVQEHVDYVTPGLKGTMLDLRSPTVRRRSKSVKGKSGSRKHSQGSRKTDLSKYASHKNTSALATCDQYITPACIRALYNFEAPSPNATVSSNNSLGIFEEGDYYAQEDLDAFFTTFAPYIANGTHPILNAIDGGEAPVAVEDAGSESDLDFQLAYPIIYPQTTTLYQADDEYYADGGNGTQNGIFNTFLDAIDGSYCTYSAYGETGNDPVLDPSYPDSNGYGGQLMCGIYKPTNVISISYGEFEDQLPAYYQQRQCNEFLKLGLQGVSIFVASGDTGVGGKPTDDSIYGCAGPDDTVFTPSQPNGCPWITNVGATQVFAGKTVFEPESAAFDASWNYSSGGGFSNVFPIPDYQKDAVASYFKDHEPPYPYYYNGNYLNATNGGVYNRNGRGIPDVSANGDNIVIFNQGYASLNGGTSASCPIFASLINRIVEERLAIGKGPLGFINPVLYQNPQVLNDITNGTNPGCGTDGFEAVEGWDPATGLGTPNYPKLLDLFLSLP
ncbi:Aorsin [Cytospora mali]|uniref:Aorsin n=1 Tax=Cytospora mali TaxID=578113 RepID=A0A194UXF4_CYTMA|nr:Aorsin [Valsa mali var. pyri (nom. inval.)]